MRIFQIDKTMSYLKLKPLMLMIFTILKIEKYVHVILTKFCMVV